MGFMDNLKKQLALVQVKYLGGHPELSGPSTLGLGSSEGKLSLNAGINPLLEIPLSDIVGLTLEKASHRSAGKAAAGAIVGGVLTGGFGLLAGAALGGRKKDDSVIVLTVKYGVANVDLFFAGAGLDTAKTYPQVAKLLR